MSTPFQAPSPEVDAAASDAELAGRTLVSPSMLSLMLLGIVFSPAVGFFVVADAWRRLGRPVGVVLWAVAGGGVMAYFLASGLMGSTILGRVIPSVLLAIPPLVGMSFAWRKAGKVEASSVPQLLPWIGLGLVLGLVTSQLRAVVWILTGNDAFVPF